MKPLYEDQIHNGPFIEACTHIWSDDLHRTVKSGVWDYYTAISKEFNKPLVDNYNVPKNAVIFIGMCHLIENVYAVLPRDGNYIIVHRTNDRQYIAKYDAVKPPSVKHVYTVDCEGTFNNVTAIPFGNASINGNDYLVNQIAVEAKRKTDKKVFVCYNTNKNTPHRNESIPAMKKKDFAFVFELNYPTVQMAPDEFYRQVRAHKYTMALAGCGADASRQWAAIQLGSIPIVTDCPQMRHFSDLPMIFCPPFEQLTEQWLDAHDMSKKSTLRMRASYWQAHIQAMKKEHGIS